jgi:hypothetical protein
MTDILDTVHHLRLKYRSIRDIASAPFFGWKGMSPLVFRLALSNRPNTASSPHTPAPHEDGGFSGLRNVVLL